MKDNVLFINRDSAEIKEFYDAMQDYAFEIDTADSGLEAAVLLHKKNYKVVVTGMNLSTYDGTKLIAYLNVHCPYTACIVYTTRIDLAQLRLLVNKRDVFRIFLKPVNYRGDFYHAIQDGFTYYDMRKAEQEDQKFREEKQKLIEDASVGIKKTVLQGEVEQEWMRRFLLPLIQWNMESFDSALPEEEQRMLAEYEQSIIKDYLKKEEKPCCNLSDIRKRIEQEFVQEEKNQRIELNINQKPVKLKTGFYQQMYIILWIVVKQIANINSSYETSIHIDFQLPFHPEVQVRGYVGKEALQRCRESTPWRERMEIDMYILKALTRRCQRKLEEDTVSYKIEMWTAEEKKVK